MRRDKLVSEGMDQFRRVHLDQGRVGDVDFVVAGDVGGFLLIGGQFDQLGGGHLDKRCVGDIHLAVAIHVAFQYSALYRERLGAAGNIAVGEIAAARIVNGEVLAAVGRGDVFRVDVMVALLRELRRGRVVEALLAGISAVAVRRDAVYLGDVGGNIHPSDSECHLVAGFRLAGADGKVIEGIIIVVADGVLRFHAAEQALRVGHNAGQ